MALLISFSDYPGTTAPATFESRLFGNGSGSPPFDSLKNFYGRSSCGQLTITGDVLGWYQAPYARSTVCETDAGRQNLIKEALNYYEAQGHDFSQYDNDGDGTIDYFCVFWTGPHGEWASFWWGNCLSKLMLDCITPTVVSSGARTVTMRASGLYPDAVLFKPGAGRSSARCPRPRAIRPTATCIGASPARRSTRTKSWAWERRTVRASPRPSRRGEDRGTRTLGTCPPL